MAERTLIDPRGAVDVPDHVDSVTAAAVPNPGISAWTALEYAAEVAPGDSVLVLGATGVTGSIAVQLAKSVFGAGHVVVAGRNRERLQWLRTVGADEAIALGSEALAAQASALHADRPLAAVLDYLWGEPAETTLRAISEAHPSTHFHRTRFVEIGSMASPTLTLPAGILRGTGLVVSGVGFGSVPPDVMARVRTEALPRLFDMVADDRLHLRTEQRPLADIGQVWTASEPSGTRVVLTP